MTGQALCESHPWGFSREFLRINDECADKIYDIRERSDISREYLLNSDGVASRFYQMEADAVSDGKQIVFPWNEFRFSSSWKIVMN